MKSLFKIAAALLSVLMLAAALSGIAVFGEAAEEYEEKKESYTFDGEEGSNLEDTVLADSFVMGIVRAAGGDAIVRDDGQVLMQSYASFYLDPDMAYDCLSGAYTFSLDYQNAGDNPALSGIFVRMIDPESYAVTNPKNAGVQQSFGLYEWDWYKENNGKEKGISSIGGSGIRVYVNGKKIGVTVKTRVEDGLYVYSNGVEIDAPEGFAAGGMNNFRFVDDGKSKVEIYVAGKLLSTVEYGGEPGTWPDGDEGDSEVLYYKHADIKDASGNSLMVLENARISAQYSMVGVGNRGGSSTTFDNLELSWMQKKKAATPAPTEAPATEKPAETQKATQAPAATEKPVFTPSTGNKGNGGNYTWIFIVCGVVALGAVAAIVISTVKGKKK